MSPEAGDLGIEQVKSLLTFFDNPEEVTKADVHQSSHSEKVVNKQLEIERYQWEISFLVHKKS